MDDAATAFATACAVIAASTGMVLCLAPKNVNDAVIDEEPITKEEKEAVVLEEEEEAATTTEEVMKEANSPEPILEEEPVVSDEPANDVAATTTEALPEQRPDDSAANDATSPMKKKRRFTLRGDRSHRIFEGKSQARPNFRKAQSMKWLPFRPNNKKSDAVNVGQEV